MRDQQRLAGDRYSHLSGGLGAGTCRIDSRYVRGADGSSWPDSQSSYPSCDYSADYQALQNALVALSAALGDSRINPGATDGKLVDGLPSNQVMGAIVLALPHLKAKLGTYTTAALTIGLAFGASTTKAKEVVKGYMGPLAIAINAVAALKGGSGGGSTAITVPETPWFKTWWGAGSIAIGVFGALYLLTRR